MIIYGINFFSLSRVKIALFAFFVAGYALLSYTRVAQNEFVDWAPIEQMIPAIIFVLVVSYVFAAFLEYTFYKVRRKWPRWF